MNSEQRKMPEIELENLILRIKTDILSLIVSGESLNRILHEIEEKGRNYVPGYWETARYTSGEWGNLRPEQIEIVAALNDLTDVAVQRKEKDREIKSLAFYDTLTGLSNRRHFTDRFDVMINEHIQESQKLGLIFIDLDHFKWVNDSLGHDAGDRLLIQAAERIKASVSHDWVVARLGGDEFTVIVNNIQSAEDVSKVAERIIDSFKIPVLLDNHEIRVTLSAGISMFPDHGTAVSNLMKKADKAMYQAKQYGRNHCVMYQPSNDEGNDNRFLFKSQFESALTNRQFILEYQPRIELDTGEISSLEALVRWNHPVKGKVGPIEFISLAEETGFIVPLGKWVLREACMQNKRWLQQGLPPVRVAVNVSAKQFCHSSFLYRVKEILQESQLDPTYLEIEITESALMKDEKHILHTLEVFKDMGIYVSIDDFGTGYSSLNYLKHFTVDALKIDRSFIKDLPRDKVLPKMILSLARKLKLQVIAEGVENYAQHTFLLNNGCHQAQGFLYCKPLPASAVERLLNKSWGC